MNVNKILKANVLFFAIVILAALTRLTLLSTIPGSLNQDETALGYNAYAIMLTGRDEYGRLFPLALQSFGDWKLIGYPLVSIPFIALFGLNELAIRLPSALSGITQVVLIYFIGKKLFKKKSIALFASFFLAVSPWSIYFSRMAYEVNLATTFFLAGLLSFMHFLEDQKSHKRAIILSAVFFALPLFIYHAYIVFLTIFVPLLGVWLFLTNGKRFSRNKETILAAGIFAFLLVVTYLGPVRESSAKLSTVTVWNSANVIYNRSEKLRTDHAPEMPIVGKIVYSRIFTIFYQVGQNYVASFSPTFLFDSGGQKLLHNLGYFGNLCLFDALLLFVGFASLFWYREKHLPLLALWLFVAPLASSITTDAPSSTRLFILLPLFMLIAACGADTLLDFVRKKTTLSKLIGAVLVIGFLLNVLLFFDGYFVHINYQKALDLHYGYKQAVLLAQKYPHDKVIMYGPEGFPYISFLFYEKYDPRTFEKEVLYYPKSVGGFISEFILVRSFGRYNFVTNIDYAHLEPNTLYIDSRGIRKEDLTINLPSGEPVFKYFFK